MPEKLPFSFQEKPKYPFYWAKGIVDQFAEEYTRATEIFLIVSEMSIKHLYSLLMRNSPYWNQCKQLIKTLNKYLEGVQDEDLADAMERYDMVIPRICDDRLAFHLHIRIVKLFPNVKNLSTERVNRLTGRDITLIIEE